MSLVLPVHEQLYPSKLLPHRLEEYVLDSGPPTQNRHAGAKLLTGSVVLPAVVAAQASLSLANIDPRYFVGTCFHEAGCTNEWDTEVATASSPSGFQSVGAYQIGDEEARTYGYQLADMLDFDKATACMVQLAEHNRSRLRTFAGLAPGAPDPDYVDAHGVTWKGGTMRAYLAMDMGTTASRAVRTIQPRHRQRPSHQRSRIACVEALSDKPSNITVYKALCTRFSVCCPLS